MPRVRSKAYKVTLPGGSYTEDDLRKIERWSSDNCCRAIVQTDGERVVWVARREKTRSKGEWQRHIRGVFSTLRLDAQPLGGDKWLELYTETEASEIIREAIRRTRLEPRTGDDATQDDDTRNIIVPSGIRGAAVRGSRVRTSFEVVKGA